ncbi:MAG: PPK2 family polyphosphate--nucleotide phosphotransferase [Phycisphaerae bacterium]|nr:MAG: PPK2 family polyphosphate--nucleotide phosphotransferase [Phycisphaerae bacterium]
MYASFMRNPNPTTLLCVHPGMRDTLTGVDPTSTPGVAQREDVSARTAENVARIGELAQVLWADNRFSLLVVLQGMDTAGKDGVIRHVFAGIDPQGCRVTSFKRPSVEELSHDYLWRVHAACPPRGSVGVFNRSHYEDVGVVRVHKRISREICEARYRQINEFERHLVENGTRVVKFFLHISKAEQKERLLTRIRDPLKGWKMEEADLAERRRWRAYMKVYSEAIEHCSTNAAPWYVIPADKKWYRDFAVSAIVRGVLEGMKLRVPVKRLDRTRLERALQGR